MRFLGKLTLMGITDPEVNQDGVENPDDQETQDPPETREPPEFPEIQDPPDPSQTFNPFWSRFKHPKEEKKDPHPIHFLTCRPKLVL